MPSRVDERLWDAVVVPEAAARPGSAPDGVLAKATALLGDRLTSWALEVSERACADVFGTLSAERQALFGDLIRPAIQQASFELMAYLTGRRAAKWLNRDQRSAILAAVREELDTSYPGIMNGIRTLERHWRLSFIDLILPTFPVDDARALLAEVECHISLFFDQQIDEAAGMYAAEERRRSDDRAHERRELVTRLLDGGLAAESRVEQVLELRVAHEHAAIMLWVDRTPAGDLLPVEAELARSLSRAVPGSILTVPVEAGEMWGWVSHDEVEPDAVVTELSDLLAGYPFVRAAVGEAVRGLGGIRASHLMAASARRYASTAQRPSRVTRYRDHSHMGLLLADAEQARWFVQDEIGPLLGADPALADLRLTLLTLSRNNGNLGRTAEDLFVHRNTVSYRVRRIADLLGREPLSRLLSTHAALELAALLDEES